MTEIETLIQSLQKFPYPDSMKMVKGEILGRAFFPGGKGTFDLSDTISDKQIMILGQDFDCETGYAKSKNQGKENIKTNPTWRNILKFLDVIKIPHNNCFFTNAIMGVRIGNVATRQSPAFKHPDFIKDCQAFFLKQLELQKPKAIFVLGKYPAQFLAEIAEELHCWRSIKTFASIDKEEDQVQIKVTFKNEITSNLVVLVHPSLRHLNIKNRKYKDFPAGHSSEVEMAKAVIHDFT